LDTITIDCREITFYNEPPLKVYTMGGKSTLLCRGTCTIKATLLHPTDREQSSLKTRSPTLEGVEFGQLRKYRFLIPNKTTMPAAPPVEKKEQSSLIDGSNVIWAQEPIHLRGFTSSISTVEGNCRCTDIIYGETYDQLTFECDSDLNYDYNLGGN